MDNRREKMRKLEDQLREFNIQQQEFQNLRTEETAGKK